jgi:heptaprenyl diphosphate synthase
LTPSPTDIETADPAVTRKTMLLLAAVALNAAELALPRLPFFPWLKPGLANVVTILWIIRYGFADAMLYTALRIFLSGFYFGFSLFTFSLSASGGLLSTAAMSAMWITLGRRNLLGTVGMAATGALFHNAGQLAAVYFMMSSNMGVLGQLPFMLAASAVFGGIVGMLAPAAAKVFDSCDGKESPRELRRKDGNRHCELDPQSPSSAVTILDKISVASTFALSISLMLIDNIRALIAATGIFSLTPWILNLKKPGVMLYPLKFYPLFIFVAFTYLVFTPGTRVEFAPFITIEGLFAFCKQSMRLWCWLQTAHILKKFKFHLVFMSILRKLFTNQSQKETLRAGMIALERFPEAVRAAKPPARRFLLRFISNPKAAFAEYMGAVAGRLGRIVKEPF